MSRIRITIVAEYEIPESAVVDTPTGQAIRIGQLVVQPTLEFLQLSSHTSSSTTWTPLSEDLADAVLLGEAQTTLVISDAT